VPCSECPVAVSVAGKESIAGFPPQDAHLAEKLPAEFFKYRLNEFLLNWCFLPISLDSV